MSSASPVETQLAQERVKQAAQPEAITKQVEEKPQTAFRCTNCWDFPLHYYEHVSVCKGRWFPARLRVAIPHRR